MQLRDVSFAYDSRPDTPALQGCSLTLKPGQVTALVGPSGGGKTTVTNLLARFYEPDAGTVTLDNVDLRTLKARTVTSNPDPNQVHWPRSRSYPHPHHSPLTTHFSPLTTHHSPLTTHHSPFTTHHSPLTPQPSPLAPQPSPLTPQPSP